MKTILILLIVIIFSSCAEEVCYLAIENGKVKVAQSGDTTWYDLHDRDTVWLLVVGGFQKGGLPTPQSVSWETADLSPILPIRSYQESFEYAPTHFCTQTIIYFNKK